MVDVCAYRLGLRLNSTTKTPYNNPNPQPTPPIHPPAAAAPPGRQASPPPSPCLPLLSSHPNEGEQVQHSRHTAAQHRLRFRLGWLAAGPDPLIGAFVFD